MNEEIDIIELLKRVKEGKAPKEIEINGIKYFRNRDDYFMDAIDLMYEHYDCPTDNTPEWWLDDKGVTLDTKIKILDKPIIEEIPLIEIKHDYSNGKTTDTYEVERAITNEELARKINEIIKKINKEEK